MRRLAIALVVGMLVLATLACDLGGALNRTPLPTATSMPEALPPTATSTPETLEAIEPENAASIKEVGNFSESDQTATSLVFSPDSVLFALATSKGIHLYERATQQEVSFLPASEDYSYSFGFSPDGNLLAWAPQKGVVEIWDVAGRAERSELNGFTEQCCSKITFSPHGQLLAVLDGQSVKLWDLGQGQEVYTRNGVQDFTFSPDGETLAFVSSDEIKVTLWTISSQQEIQTLEGFSTAAPWYGALFSPNWEVMAWITRGRSQLMDVSSGEMGAELPFQTIAFSPDGQIMAGADPGWYGDTYLGEVRLLRVPDAELLATLRHEDIVWSMEFSPDGRILATVAEGRVTLWDVASAEALTHLSGATAIQTVDFSPDGRTLATKEEDGSIRLWGSPTAGS